MEYAQDGERGLALFARGRQVGVQPAERLGAGHRAQAAGDLQPDLHGPDVLPAAVVGERHLKIMAVAKDLVAVAVEPVEQVDVLGSPALAPPTRMVTGIGRPAGVDELTYRRR